MPKMMIFITERVPQGLRGQLTRWMLQLKPGIFIGTLSKRVGEKLWNLIQEKLKGGRAIWVQTMNNEQRYSIATHGSIKWQISEFEGLQLITKPINKAKKNRKPTMSKGIPKNKSQRQSNFKSPTVEWDVMGTPEDFIIRTVNIQLTNSQIRTNFSGSSAYWEIPPEKLWLKQWKEEVTKFGNQIIDFIVSLPPTDIQEKLNARIVSIDIETTDYMPKAREGFINIIGLAILDLTKIGSGKKELNDITLEIKQVMNMTRNRTKVPQMLELIAPAWKNTDVMLVFGKDFDISIINNVIKVDSLQITLPKNIIDLQTKFVSLKSLEAFLQQKLGIKRTLTEKGKISEYYKQFKGEGSLELDKQIEPIGTYNLTDALTPLLAYLYFKSTGNIK